MYNVRQEIRFMLVKDLNLSRRVFLIGDFFISKNNEDSIGLTNKKLQKLLYYSQAWSLVMFQKPLFDEPIQAWVHGPAIPRVYGNFKAFALSDIQKEIDEARLETLGDNEKELLEEIWSVYGKYDGDYLEVLSHSERPWQLARHGAEVFEPSQAEITQESMKEFYGKKLQETTT